MMKNVVAKKNYLESGSLYIIGYKIVYQYVITKMR